jgi:aerobic-type carbon monoxide dehydrogenase small subunit (CoxS/CutS family)
MEKLVDIVLNINSQTHQLAVQPDSLLVDILRDSLGLMGTKKGCGIGECGACTVLIDGKPVNSCLVLTLKTRGKEITTIEGVGSQDEPDPVQKAFVEKGAIQCGYCTPGLVLTSKALLAKNPKPDTGQIKEAIKGHLCRCTGYVQVVDAISAAAACCSDKGDKHE